jgi:hypothetical protein
MPEKRNLKRHLNSDETQPGTPRTTKYRRLQLNQVKKKKIGEMLWATTKI